MAFFWFAAAFLTILSSKLWLIDLYGSALPWWDQWAAEGWALYIPFFEKTLALKDLFAAHCEHRIFVNRILALGALLLNGQWDARIGMVLNAFITAGTGVALSGMGWTLLGKKNIAAICLFNTIVFSLPFSWECSLLGFVGNYLLIAFALFAIWFLLRAPPFRLLWFFGLFFALISLVTMGSGFFAALAVIIMVFLRIVTRQGQSDPPLARTGTGRIWLNLAGIVVLLAIVAMGFLLRVSVPGHESFKPSNNMDLMVAFCQNMAWPNEGQAWMASIVWLPSLVVFIQYAFHRNQDQKKYEFILGFGLWIAFQAAALAFTRCGILASRHTVFLSLSLPVNFLALLLLAHDRLLPVFLRRTLLIFFLVWLGFIGHSLWKISDKAHLAEAEKTKQHLVQSENNVRNFLQTDNPAALENKPLYDIPYPDPQALATVLRNKHIRAIMPAGVNHENKQGPLSIVVAKLIPKGDKLIFIGIGLLVILGLIRFYQSLGTLEKRLTSLRRSDFKQLLAPAGLALAAAVSIYAIYALYLFLSPNGLTVTYFKGQNFEQKLCRRTEKAVCRDYGENPPAWRVPIHNFSALWQGILRVPESGDYDFFAQSDDGLRLIIDGKKVIDNWRDQSWNTSSTAIRVYLEAGDHKIAVEHYNGEGESALRIKWSGGPVPPNTVLAAPYLRKNN